MSVSAIHYPACSATVVSSGFCPTDANLQSNRHIVLIVDDDPVVLCLQRFLLDAAGFAVLSASVVEEALRTFNSVRPDVVVLDYSIPGTTGSALAAQMRQLRADVPLILYSGSGEISAKDAKPFDRVLLKGTAAHSLIPVLREMFQPDDRTRSSPGDTAGEPTSEGMPLPRRSRFPV